MAKTPKSLIETRPIAPNEDVRERVNRFFAELNRYLSVERADIENTEKRLTDLET